MPSLQGHIEAPTKDVTCPGGMLSFFTSSQKCFTQHMHRGVWGERSKAARWMDLRHSTVGHCGWGFVVAEVAEDKRRKAPENPQKIRRNNDQNSSPRSVQDPCATSKKNMPIIPIIPGLGRVFAVWKWWFFPILSRNDMEKMMTRLDQPAISPSPRGPSFLWWSGDQKQKNNCLNSYHVKRT